MLALALGTLLAAMRVSPVPTLRGAGAAYVEVVRNTPLSAREATYIEAARAIGARDIRIMRKYLFGNVIQSVPVLGTLNAADAILTLAGLGFLGLGIQSTAAAEWSADIRPEPSRRIRRCYRIWRMSWIEGLEFAECRRSVAIWPPTL